MNNNEEVKSQEVIKEEELAANTESDTVILELVGKYQEFVNSLLKDVFQVAYNAKESTINITVGNQSFVTYSNNGYTTINFNNDSETYIKYKAFIPYYLSNILDWKLLPELLVELKVGK